MARMTHKDSKGWYINDQGVAYDERRRGEEVDRLAAYEDTGLTPKEIRELSFAKKRMDRLENDGRLVVLPCKPSDVTVYQLRSKKHAHGIGVSERHISCTNVWSGGHYCLKHQGMEPCVDEDLGKTWFLTRSEAEKALTEQR